MRKLPPSLPCQIPVQGSISSIFVHTGQNMRELFRPPHENDDRHSIVKLLAIEVTWRFAPPRHPP